MKRIINSVIYASFCVVALLFAQTAMAQRARTITGQVLDEKGQPMVGATVVLAGNNGVGTTTDVQGKYKIKATQNDLISFSFLGYVEVSERVGNRTTINVVMQQENVNINEVVVIGYGTQQKSDLTGAVVTVEMEDLGNTAVQSVDEALQGRLAGVEVSTTSGEPGAAAEISIRGTRSIDASNNPLIVVDGVEDAVANFSEIDPSEIKNVTVLKDASSTAIYGARGENGVIIVTTHGAKGSKMNITFRANFNVAHLPRSLDMMNGVEFASYLNDYFTHNSTTRRKRMLPSYSWRYPNPAAQTEATDWISVMTRPALSQSYFLSLSGGNRHSKVLFSISYRDNQGIVRSTDSQTLSGRIKIDHQAFKWLNLGINANYYMRWRDRNSTTISSTSKSVTNLSPLMKPLDTWDFLAGDGTIGGNVYDSPYYKSLFVTNKDTQTRLTFSPYIELRLAKGLSLRSQFSYVHTINESFYYSPSNMPVAARYHYGGSATRTYNTNRNLRSSTTLTFNRTIRKEHKLNAMATFTAARHTNQSMSLSGRGYIDDKVTANNMDAIVDRRNLTSATGASETVDIGVMGRVNYTYRGRYHFTVTARGDASSRFAKGRRWGFFPSAAFRWSISKEKWMRGTKSWLSNLAFRVSVGRSGNNSIPVYQSQSLLSNGRSWLFGESPDVAYYPSTLLSNPDVTWQKTDALNVGLNASFLKNRIEVELEYYMSRTKDLLFRISDAVTTGYSSHWENVGNTQNMGVELTFTSRNIVRRNFRWSTTLTAAHNSSKILDIYTTNGYLSTYARSGYMAIGHVPGFPAHSLWGFQYEGVWHTQDEINLNNTTKAFASPSVRIGSPRFADRNHDGILNRKDLIYLGSAAPILKGGIQNSFRIYKNFTVGVMFTYSIGGRMYNTMEYTTLSGGAGSNKDRRFLEGWHFARNPFSQRPGSYLTSGVGSDLHIYDASFLRLQSVNFGYRINLRKKTRYLRDISITASAQNLALFTKYTGYDPDAMMNGRRYENGAYPKNRSYSLAIQIRY